MHENVVWFGFTLFITTIIHSLYFIKEILNAQQPKEACRFKIIIKVIAVNKAYL